MTLLALSEGVYGIIGAVAGAAAGAVFGFMGGAWRERRKRSEAWASGVSETYRQLREALHAYGSGDTDPKHEAVYREMYFKTEMHQPSRARSLVESLGPDLAVAAEKVRAGDVGFGDLLEAMREDAGR